MTRLFKSRRSKAKADRPATARRTDSADPYALEALEPRLLLAADLGAGLDVSAAWDRDEPLVAEVLDELSTDGRFGNLQGELSPLAGAIRQSIGNETAEPLDLTELGGLFGTTTIAVAVDTDSGPNSRNDTGEIIAQSENEFATIRTELVFIDAGVEDYQQLLADLELQTTADRQVEVYLLDAQRDGGEQIASLLSGYQGLDAVHILSHGSAGEIRLGNGVLNTATLAGYSDTLSAWGKAFSADGDLLIYGCDLAGNSEGQALIAALADLSGADVAASTDRTGHANQGGDWDLEYRFGMIESATPFSASLQQDWNGVLATADIIATADTYIDNNLNSDNFGASTSLVVDKSGGGIGDQRALLQFDLSTIPVAATITSATLQMEATSNTGAFDINLYELTASWAEGSADGTADAANWNERQTGTNWGTAGGSFDPTVVATLNTGSTGQHTWDLTSLVQEWNAGSKVNNGIIIGSSDNGGATITYDSREGITPPVLEISYLDTTLYLDGIGDGSDVPIANLKTSAPTDTTLDNFDPGRDTVTGLLLAKGGSGVNETDPVKYQLWVDTSGGTSLDGQATLNLWSAIKGFDTSFGASVTAYLLDSNADGSSVTSIASATVSRADWDATDSGTWIEDTFDFGSVSYQLANDRYLGVKIIVDGTSQDDIWLAYDATANPSQLIYAGGANNAVNDAATTDEDTAVVIDVDDNDSGGLTILDHTLTTNGTVADNGDGTFTYTPDANYNGADSFDYLVTDSSDATSHYWRLDGDAVDQVGSNDGTVFGTTTVAGHYGEALRFDDTTENDYVSIPDVAYAADSTVSFRFKVDDNSGTLFQYFYSHGNAGTANSLNVYLGETGNAAYPDNIVTNIQDSNDGADAGALNVDIGSGGLNLIGDGQWHSYTLTLESVVGSKVYIDGVLQNSSGRGADALNPAAPLILGAPSTFSSGRYYGGDLDSLQIIDQALNASDVAALHAGTASATDTATVNITVDPVNDAPQLSDTLVTLDDISINAPPPAGAVGTLIRDIADLIGGGGQDNITDADVGALAGVAITAADTSNGAWHYTTDGGSSWNPLGAVSNSSALLLAADADTRIYFQPNVAYTGTISDAISLHAWDQTSGSNGGTVSLGPISENLLDSFSDPAAYDNNHGSVNWVSDWIEDDSGGGSPVTGGDIRVTGQKLQLKPVTTGDSIFREANLSGASVPRLSFDYSNGLTGSQLIELQVSTGGGAFTTLETFSASLNSGVGSVDIDISAYIAADTRIRFYVASGASGAQLDIDNIKIQYDINTAVGGTTAFSSASDTAALTVVNLNDAPVLGAIGDKNIDEGSTLSFTATATDSDVPADTLTFSLDAASLALGMTIDSNTGAFSWTPTESQGGLTPSVTIRVTDDGTGALWDEETITITVNDTNTAPVVGAIGDQSVDELATLTFTATATDADLPADTLSFSLDAASIALGMTIDANSGAFSWTPTESQGGLTPSVTVTVTDDGTGSLVDSETFTITVNDVNVAPVLGAIGDQSVDEGATLSFTATATDSDLPADTLTFSLDAASLALGMTIDSNTGAFSWTPTESQGGLTPSVTIRVTDDGTGALWDEETITITVNDTNTAPVVGAIGDQSVDELATLTFTATATDADLPADTLSFSLDAASIALGMTIDANSGAFSWTPTESQGGLTPSVTVTVTDDGTGSLVDSETFTITVNDVNVAPVLGAIGDQSVDEGATLSFHRDRDRQ